MLDVIGVDLAAKFSAVVWLHGSGKVADQFDSFEISQSTLAGKLRWITSVVDEVPHKDGYVVVIEDLPPHIPHSSIVKSVAQLQGRIIQALGPSHLIHTYFVPPAYWQRDMGVFRATPEETALKAKELGYEPPDLLQARKLAVGVRGKATAVREALKQQTDYVDAYLIAKWAQICMSENRVWDMHIVKQYKD